jgi:ribose transport system ATP-binding protein
LLALRNITKCFPSVRALDGVSLEFAAGEIHALVGENGAGKSTAIKVMTGIHQPDSGEIMLQGAPVRLESYRDALAKGIGIVHQELQVIPDASVAENIMIDKLVTRGLGILNWPEVFAQARRHMDRIGLDVPPERLVRGLSAASKQMIQIAKALSAEVKVLLLDEPTSSLTEHETRRLFALLKELKTRGVAIVFVSHKLDEVFALCDRVTVLRDGKRVGTKAIGEVTPRELVQMMIGREHNDDHLGVLSPAWDEPVLQAENIVREGKAKGCSFTLYRREILGFYGLVGSGRTELARILIGEDRADSGRILIHGREAQVRSVGDALYRHRLGYVTENRKEEGLLLEDSLRTNLALTIWPRIRNSLTRRISGTAEAAVAEKYVDAMRIRTPSLEQRVKNLSGGNQQKVSIGKVLAADCDILIIDEPTVGVDVGAKEQIHQLIWDLAAKQGKSIILISSDLPEIIRIASRILVFRNQRIVGEVRDIDVRKKTYQQVTQEIAPYFL